MPTGREKNCIGWAGSGAPGAAWSRRTCKAAVRRAVEVYFQIIPYLRIEWEGGRFEPTYLALFVPNLKRSMRITYRTFSSSHKSGNPDLWLDENVRSVILMPRILGDKRLVMSSVPATNCDRKNCDGRPCCVGLEDPLARTSPKVVFEKSAGAHIAIFVFNFRRRGEDVLQQIKQLANLYK